MSAFSKPILVASGAASLLLGSLGGTALSQTPTPAGNGTTALPDIVVEAPKQTAGKQKQRPKTASVARHVVTPPTAPPKTVSPAEQLAAKGSVFDQARSNIYTTVGTTSDTISHDTIRDLPGGTNQSVEEVLQQFPGVSQDSAASGLLHVRNDHANVQYRINGVLLPDGVTGFGSIFDTSFIGSMSLVTGALPAEYGLRTVGLVDIKTRTDLFNNSGEVGVYGGSHGTITPSIEYGGTFGGNCPATTTTTPGSVKALPASTDCFAGVQYYFTGRYLQNTVGIENPTPAYNAIHDFTQQDRGFAYMSAFVDPTTRISLISGTANNNFQIPNTPGQSPIGQHGNVTNAFGVTSFNSALLNENQTETTQFDVLSLQKSVDGFDGQLSYFTRYNQLQYTPDPVGDLLINGIASNISRTSSPTASRAMVLISSIRRIRSAPASQSAASRRSSAIRRWLTLHGLRRHRQWQPRRHHRQRLDNRRAVGHLCPGRVEAHQPIYDQRRLALRSNGSIRQRQPVQPAIELHLQALREHHVPCRLCALLYAAGAGGGGARQHQPVQQHHRRSVAARTIRSCRSAHIISMPASIKNSNSDAPQTGKAVPISISASMPTTRSRLISSTTAFSARPWC